MAGVDATVYVWFLNQISCMYILYSISMTSKPFRVTQLSRRHFRIPPSLTNPPKGRLVWPTIPLSPPSPPLFSLSPSPSPPLSFSRYLPLSSPSPPPLYLSRSLSASSINPLESINRIAYHYRHELLDLGNLESIGNLEFIRKLGVF